MKSFENSTNYRASADEFYLSLASCEQLEKKYDEIISFINSGNNDGETKIQMDILCLLAVAYEDFKLIEKLFLNNLSKDNLEKSYSIFNYSLHIQHWFLKLLENKSFCSISNKLSKNICSKINIIKTLQNYNEESFIQNAAGNCEDFSGATDFFKLYYKVIELHRKVIQIYQHFGGEINEKELLLSCCKQSLLTVVSDCFDLSDLKIWDIILTELGSNSNEEQINFTCYVIIYSIIYALQLCKEISSNPKIVVEKDIISTIIKKAETLLLELSVLDKQVEVLENIFVLLFLKNKESSTFFCHCYEVKLLLTFLKSCINEIQQTYLYDRSLKSMKRLSKLSKYVTDAFWRYELIVDENFNENKDLISRMLATPESLIYLCLKRNKFEKINQVIQVFSLQKTEISKEMDYSEQLFNFKQKLEQNLIKKHSYREDHFNNIKCLINDHFDNNIYYNTFTSSSEDKEISSSNEELNLQEHLTIQNKRFMNILDLAIIQPDNYYESEQFLNIAVSYNTLNPNFDSTFSKFCKTLVKIFKHLNETQQNYSVRDVLLTSEINLDLKSYFNELEKFSKLCHATDLFLQALKNPKIEVKQLYNSFLQIQSICVCEETSVKYFTRFLNYFNAIFNVIYINQNYRVGKNCSSFDLLKHRRVNIVNTLIYEKKVDPHDLEKIFTKMSLDMVYHVALNCFPQIWTKSVPANYTIQLPSSLTLKFIQKRNWLLAFLIENIHGVNEDSNLQQFNAVRTKIYTNFIQLPRIEYLKKFYQNNKGITVLHNVVDVQKLNLFCNYESLNSDITSSQASNGSLETGEEIMEGKFSDTDWEQLLEIVNSFSEKQKKDNKQIENLLDNIIFKIVGDRIDNSCYKFIKKIKNERLQEICVKNNFKFWPGTFCVEIMKSKISKYEKDQVRQSELKNQLAKIEFCVKVNCILQDTTWADILQFCEKSPVYILEKLLEPPVKINLLLQFLDIYKPREEILTDVKTEKYFSQLFNSHETDLSKIKQIFDKFPASFSKILLNKLIDRVRNVEHLSFIINYLSNMGEISTKSINDLKISLKIVSCFHENDLDQLWPLIRHPISIIEVLIMNTRLEKLNEVINVLHDSKSEEFVEEIDQLTRIYAEKSLDFRVVIPSSASSTSSENKLMESMDSSNFGTNKKDFLMPDNVPDKSEWIKNEEVNECMCCNETIFSMFNRRHHCRRCGRVICDSCSGKRMVVPTYGEIRVRVCKDCYQQTYYDSPSTYSVASIKSTICDYWQLTDNESHNKIVREEFSFEYAPSVYLCLAILKYHSMNKNTYKTFLIDQCHKLLQLIYPIPLELNHEIDYLLVIKMLKSLAIAAKMQSHRIEHDSNALIDRILSHADLLELLIERGCLHLIPHVSLNPQNPYIDTSTVRRLRDKLLEDEQWNLALEVSTKAGLDNTGVFAAWGKSCLKAGSLKRAREKFQRCFDKTSYYENSLEFSCSLNETSEVKKRYLQNSSTNTYIIGSFDSKSNKNLPLLNEIIQILEENSYRLDFKDTKDFKNTKNHSFINISTDNIGSIEKNDSAMHVLSKLQNLSKIIEKNQEFTSSSSKQRKINQVYFEECIYYLYRYGTHSSLLKFYVRHGNFQQALNHLLEYELNPEMFIEVYTLCLKNGNITDFHEKMSEMDSTLDIWKNYLKQLCRHFEKQGMLHSLYQLQQFMGDYVRAAMTSIKFYKDDANSYTELKTRVQFLEKAENHLKQELEQEQWVEVATVRKTDPESHQSFEEKSITNPSLVMKIDSKSVNKHISTIRLQMEVTNFLAECEENGAEVVKILGQVLPFANKEFSECKSSIPTLFGSYYEKVEIAVLCILCGKNVEEGFSLTFRIIEDFKLDPVKVYCQSGKQLAKDERYDGLAQLVNCIRCNGVNNANVTEMCDEILILAIQTLTKSSTTGSQLDGLIKLITNRSAKISAYIETKQLKSAYLLAVKHRKMGDIRRILKEAEYLNQVTIKTLCLKVLQNNS